MFIYLASRRGALVPRLGFPRDAVGIQGDMCLDGGSVVVLGWVRPETITSAS